jgi:hypothetical protein
MKNTALLIALLLFLSLFLISNVSAFENESSVDVAFQIITGSGRSDYYAGDYFWYNISLLNSGSTLINGTFNVKVLNNTGEIIEPSKDFTVTLQPNASYFLYPNYTRLDKEERSIFYFKTSGTYTIVLSSELLLRYYRFYSNGAYTQSSNYCEFPIDVMPSYQRVQNDNWNDFLSKNEDYMQKVQQNIDQSEIQAQKTLELTYLSLFIAVSSIFLAFGSFFVAWTDLSQEKQKKNRWWYRLFTGFVIFILVLLGIMFWLVG